MHRFFPNKKGAKYPFGAFNLIQSLHFVAYTNPDFCSINVSYRSQADTTLKWDTYTGRKNPMRFSENCCLFRENSNV